MNAYFFFTPGVLPWPIAPVDPFFGPMGLMNGAVPDSTFDHSYRSGRMQFDGNASQCRSLVGKSADSYNLYCANPLFDDKPAKGKNVSLSFKPGVEYSFAKSGHKIVIPATLRAALSSQNNVYFTVQRLATAGGPQAQYHFFLRESSPTGAKAGASSSSTTAPAGGAGSPKPGMGTIALDFGVSFGATILVDRMLVMGGVPEKLHAPVMLSTHYLASLISTRSVASANVGMAHIPLFTGVRFLSSEFLDLIGVPRGTTVNNWASTGAALTPFVFASRFPALQTAFASAAGVGMHTGKLAPGIAGGGGFLGGCSQALGAAGALLIADYVGDLSLKAAIADNPDKKLKNFLWDVSNQSAGGFSGWLMGTLPTATKLIQAGAATVSGNRDNLNDYLDERAQEVIKGSRQFGETMEANLVRFSGRAMESLDMGGLALQERYALGLLPPHSYTEKDRIWMEGVLARDPDSKRKALDHFWEAWIKSTESRIAEVYQDNSPITLTDQDGDEFRTSERQMVSDAYNLLSYTAPYASKAQKIRTLVDSDGKITDPHEFRTYMMELIPPRLDDFANSLKPALLQTAMECISVYPSGDPNQPANLFIDWWKFESKIQERFRNDREVLDVFYNLATLDRMTGSPKAAAAQEFVGMVDKYGQVRNMKALRRYLLPTLEAAVLKKATEIDTAMKNNRLSDVTVDSRTGNWLVGLDTGRLTPSQMYFIDRPETRQMMADYEMLLQLYKMFDPSASRY